MKRNRNNNDRTQSIWDNFVEAMRLSLGDCEPEPSRMPVRRTTSQRPPRVRLSRYVE